jgi:hypothetical protein
MPSEVYKLPFLSTVASLVLVIASLYWARVVLMLLARLCLDSLTQVGTTLLKARQQSRQVPRYLLLLYPTLCRVSSKLGQVWATKLGRV